MQLDHTQQRNSRMHSCAQIRTSQHSTRYTQQHASSVNKVLAFEEGPEMQQLPAVSCAPYLARPLYGIGIV